MSDNDLSAYSISEKKALRLALKALGRFKPRESGQHRGAAYTALWAQMRESGMDPETVHHIEPEPEAKPEEPKWAVSYSDEVGAWDVAAHSISIHDKALVPHQHRGPRFNDVDEANHFARAFNLAGLHPDREA